MDDIAYWIWLQRVLGYGSQKLRTINLIYKEIEQFYMAGINEWKLCGCFTSKEIYGMQKFGLEGALRILDDCNRLRYKPIAFSSNEYPERLRHISNPPCVIYVKGNISDINNNICISIVGTRSATRYGIEMAYDISRGLAEAGAIVVSGGAMGVDSSAHRGAIQGGGRTVAVLGCGIDYPYLMANASLRNTVSYNGALISEYPPGYKSYSSNFPIRNRIISGLSVGVVIIEAGEKSGSLITARLALEQNRDVFAVPVDMRTSVSKGTTGLIRDGAKIVTCADDVLCEYRGIYLNDRNKKKLYGSLRRSNVDVIENEGSGYNIKDKILEHKANKVEPNLKINIDMSTNSDLIKGLPEESKIIYDILKNGKIHIDNICSISKLSSRKVLSILTELELDGLIESYSGRVYGIRYDCI